MIKRILLGVLVAGIALFVGACALGQTTSTPPPRGPAPLRVSRVYGDVTVHALRTGWVSVKESHRSWDGPRALRQLAILSDTAWTEWMPVLVFVIEHPEGVFLVDAGLAERSLTIADDPACDAPTRWVYEHLLRFSFDPSWRVDRQLSALGIDADRVRGIVATHLHADHVDAVAHLPEAVPVLLGESDWPAHDGALRCRWADVEPRLVPSTGASRGRFAHAEPLTRDGRLHVVALPGHSPGHLGVLLEVDGTALLFAGDSAFSMEQIDGGRLAGIAEDAPASRDTLSRMAGLRADGRVVVLPSHDAESLRAWAESAPSGPSDR